MRETIIKSSATEMRTDILYYYYDETGVVGFEHNGTDYYFIKNLQGDIVSIYNNSGAVVVNYTYDAWGKVLSVTGSLASTIGQINPFRYRGYYYDNETGFYYLNSRYYDPSVGRFLNADGYAILYKERDSLYYKNLYSYCDNNPISRVDIQGDFWIEIIVVSIISIPIVLYSCDVNSTVLNVTGNVFLDDMGYDLAAWMYDYAFTRRGGQLEYDSLPPMLEKKLIDSKELKEVLGEYISDNSGFFDTKDQTIEFESGDLYYAIQKASFRAWGWKDGNGKQIINIFVWDTYNFDNIRTIENGISLGNIANDMGYVLQHSGQMVEYKWWIRYEYEFTY